MRPKPLILIFVAAACGLVASIGVSEALKNRGDKNETELETTKIYVALTQLEIGEPMTPQMVKLEAWPTNLVPEDALTKLEEVEKRRPRQPIFPGEPIVEAKLIQGNRDHKIPDGLRVKSVNVTMETAVSNLLAPGDRVDVIVFLKKSQEIKKTTTRTLLENVKVYAINARRDRVRAEMETGATQTKTVSLLLTPRQVEEVTLAGELGTLQLSLRGAGDAAEATGTNDTDIGGLFPDLGPDEPDRDPLPPVTNREPRLPAVAAPVDDDSWETVILAPDGAQRYQADSEDAMPELVSGYMDEEPVPTIPNFPTEDPAAGMLDEAEEQADDAAGEPPGGLPFGDD